MTEGSENKIEVLEDEALENTNKTDENKSEDCNKEDNHTGGSAEPPNDSPSEASPLTDNPEDEEMLEGAQLERLISSLGQFDRYQIWMCAMMGLAAYLPAMPVVATTFIAFEPPHRCHIKECDLGRSGAIYNAEFLNFTTPYNEEQNSWEQCKQWSSDVANPLNSENYCSSLYFDQSSSVGCQEGYVFDDHLFSSSLITDFNLFCTSSFYRSLPSMVYMVGMFFGSYIMGAISDKIGRKNGIVLGSLLISTSGLVCALAPNYPIYLMGRFVTGIGAVGTLMIAFILAVEFIGVKHRTFVGIMIQFPFAFGLCTTGVMAYFIRDWRYLQVAVTLPSICILAFKWYLPDSIRWLVSKGRTEEAMDIVRDIAKTNNKPIIEEYVDFIVNRKVTEIETSSKTKTTLDLLRTPNMRARSLNLFFAWMSVTFMYYGLSFMSGNIGSNMFVSFILNMIMEAPACVVSWLMLDCMGRKLSLMIMYFMGGISCIAAALLDSVEDASTIMGLTLVGKFGASAAFAIVYVYAGEIFPTDYRGIAVGSCSMFARVGGLFAPFIVEVTKATPSVSPILFGVVSLVCGVLVLRLPETAGARLPQTLEESEAFGSDQKMFDCFIMKKKISNSDEEKV